MVKVDEDDKDIGNLTDIIGVDIGQTYAGGFYAWKVDPTWKLDSPHMVFNKAIKSSALRFGERWYLGQMAKRKPDAIVRAEQNLRRMVNEQWNDHFRRIKSLLTEISHFYNGEDMRKIGYIKRKADGALHAIATNKILRMVGLHIRTKVPDDRNIGIAMGRANFGRKSSFEKHFITKVRSLGYKVFFVDEKYTSQKCPCCLRQCGSIGIRVKTCTRCGKWYHRETMAAQNIAVAGLCWSKGIERPRYLTE